MCHIVLKVHVVLGRALQINDRYEFPDELDLDQDRYYAPSADRWVVVAKQPGALELASTKVVFYVYQCWSFQRRIYLGPQPIKAATALGIKGILPATRPRARLRNTLFVGTDIRPGSLANYAMLSSCCGLSQARTCKFVYLSCVLPPVPEQVSQECVQVAQCACAQRRCAWWSLLCICAA